MFLSRLEELCNQQNTTIYSVVSAVGGNTGSIDGWKKKGSIPRPELLSKIATHLNTTIDYLMERTNNPWPVTEEMRALNDKETRLIDGLRNTDESTSRIIYDMAFAALKTVPDNSNAFQTGVVFSFPKDGISHQSRKPRRSRETEQGRKRVEGSGAAGAPIATVAEDDLTISVPAKYTGDNFFIVCAQGDSMINAGINSGDFCVFQSDAYRDQGAIMYVQVDGSTDLPEGAIKRVYFHDAQVELRSANPLYAPMFYPADEVSLNGVLAAVIPSTDNSCDEDGE